MIPKIIHYCWFGKGDKPKEAMRCISSWKKYCNGYKIIEWNENNFSIEDSPRYVKEAYAAKKWAFVSDYARLWIVFNYGGIYLDTDVELIKQIDPLLKNKAYFGFENYEGMTYVNTGEGFGAEQGTSILKELMNTYDTLSFLNSDGSYNLTACPAINTPVFIEHGFKMNNSFQEIDGVALYPSDYFGPGYISKMHASVNTISIHHYLGTWTWDKGTKDKRNNMVLKKLQEVRADFLKHPIRSSIKYWLGVEKYEAIKQRLYRKK